MQACGELEKAQQTIDELNKSKAVLDSQIKALEKRKRPHKSKRSDRIAPGEQHGVGRRSPNQHDAGGPAQARGQFEERIRADAWFAESTSSNTKSASEQPSWPKHRRCGKRAELKTMIEELSLKEATCANSPKVSASTPFVSKAKTRNDAFACSANK